MSSGPSKRNEKPRSGASSWVDETPRSRAIPATGGVHRGQELRHVAEPAFENAQAFTVTLGQGAAPLHRLGIAVDAENPAMRSREQRRAVAAATKGAVDVNQIVLRSQRGEDGVEENRNMPAGPYRRGRLGVCC